MILPLRSRHPAAVVTVLLAFAASMLSGPAAHAAPSPLRAPLAAVSVALPVVTSTVTVKQDGHSFSARLSQPAGSAPGVYPVVAFGHGFLQSTSRYASTLSALAARGYIVVAPNSQGGIFPSHSAFADDLWRALVWATRTQPNAAAGLSAVAGHSMGGGAALLAADRHPQITTVATLAAAQTRPSAVAASAGVIAPALYVVGSADSIVPPATTRAMYNAKPAPAEWATITGGYHCGFLDSAPFFGFGCDSGQIARSRQLATTAALLGDWLDQQLRGAPAGLAPAGVVVETK